MRARIPNSKVLILNFATPLLESDARPEHDALRLDRLIVLDVGYLRQDAAEAVADVHEIILGKRVHDPAAKDEERFRVRARQIATELEPRIYDRPAPVDERHFRRRLRNADAERDVRMDFR